MNYHLPHIAITVTNIVDTKNFYGKIGFTIKEDLYSKEKRRHFLLIEGFGLEMELFYFEDQPKNQIHQIDLQTIGLQHIAIPIANLKIKKQDLTGKGITLLKDINVSSLGVKNFNIVDPTGIIIEFFEKEV